MLALFAALALAGVALAATFPIRSVRTIVGRTAGTGTAQVCAVRSSAPEVPLAGCVDVDPAASDVDFVLDVTAHMTPGVRECFKAVAISPEGLQSEPSEDEACGTIPGRPVLR
jgi:hypothetical protein